MAIDDGRGWYSDSVGSVVALLRHTGSEFPMLGIICWSDAE